MDELIELDIKEKVPDITDEELKSVLKKLKEMGVRRLDVLRQDAVTVEDFQGVIPIVTARLLVKKWKEDGACTRSAKDLTPASYNQQDENISSTGGRFLQPTINFDDLQSKNMLFSRNITHKDKKKILSEAADQVIEMHQLRKNLHQSSWKFVAQQLAKKNSCFFDQKIAAFGTANTVNASVAYLTNHAGHKIACKRPANSGNGSNAFKKRRSAEIQRNEYGCKSVDYKNMPDTEENLNKTIEELQEEFKLEPSKRKMRLIEEKMKLIFIKIHFDLNVAKLDILEAKKKYPFLFEVKFFLGYFEELTGIAADEALNDFVANYLQHAYNYLTRMAGRPGNSYDEDSMIQIDKQYMAAEKKMHTKQPLFIAILMMAQALLHGGSKSDAGNFILCVQVKNKKL